jgi:hypothetical protein
VPSFVNVSGTQRTVIQPWVKVGTTWRQAIFMYTKVNGTWRQGYAANVEDNFNRADAATLGTSSNYVATWTNLRQTWAIVSNQATASADPTTYPLATVSAPRQISDYELHIDNVDGAGTGLAWWVTNLNNWWAAVTDISSTVTWSCPQGGVVSGTTCNRDDSYSAPTHAAYTTYSSGSYSPAGSSTPYYGQCQSTLVTITKPAAYYTYVGQPTTTPDTYVPASVIACATTPHSGTSAQYSCPDGTNRASYTVTTPGTGGSFYANSRSDCVAPCTGGTASWNGFQGVCAYSCPSTTSTVYCTLTQAATSSYTTCEGPSTRGYACAYNSFGQCREVQTFTAGSTSCATGTNYPSGPPDNSGQQSGCYTYTPSQCPSGYTDLGSGYCQKGVPNACPNGGSCNAPDSSGSCYGPTTSYPASCACPSGYSLTGWDGTQSGCASGTVCQQYHSSYLYCPNGGSLSGSTCQLTTTYAATGAFTTTNYVKLITAAAGTISTVNTYTAGATSATSTDPAYTYANTTRIQSLKVITSNNTITITAYQNPGQTGTNNQFTYTATTPTKTITAGIIKTPATSSQGSTVDNFLLK